MIKQKIYFRADASASIGYGHFVRTLALADMLRVNFNCTFFTTSPSFYQIGEMEKVCAFKVLQEENMFEDFLSYLNGAEIVVLDNYFFTTDYQKQIKSKGCKLVCVDDIHNKHYVADAVINHVLTEESLFSRESYTRLCLGMNYALLRKPFLMRNYLNKENGHWFVSFGGTDFDNMTAKYVGYLDADSTVKSITVVIGDAYKHYNSLNDFAKIEIKKNLTATQMKHEMSRAEYAVLPSSSVCIEAISCGCKIASGFFVDNQRDYAEFLAIGHYVYPLGNLYDWQGAFFINRMHDFKFNLPGDFSKIPTRYIKLFNEL